VPSSVDFNKKLIKFENFFLYIKLKGTPLESRGTEREPHGTEHKLGGTEREPRGTQRKLAATLNKREKIHFYPEFVPKFDILEQPKLTGGNYA